MSNNILLILEGEKTEPQIFENIKKNFFGESENTIFYTVYKAEIYQLWKKVKDDEFIDIIELIRAKDEENKKKLSNILRKDIAQIYLIFDFDRQCKPDSPNFENDFINMLEYFNNETENGKIYISYPMVEALRDLKKDPAECFKSCIISLNDFKNYKKTVNTKIDYMHVKKYTKDDWFYIIIINIIKANYLINNLDSIASYIEYTSLNQPTIFNNQLIKFIKKSNRVIILSSFPFFIIDYFGEKLFTEIISNPINKTCMFMCIKNINIS